MQVDTFDKFDKYAYFFIIPKRSQTHEKNTL